VVNLSNPASADEINAAMREAAGGRMRGILAVSDEPLVSTDFIADSHSAILDAALTMRMGERMAKVVGWYDNEWGYSCRIADLIKLMKDRGI
jgi:glyceraldehyde 3-phosphate dehydrogenase